MTACYKNAGRWLAGRRPPSYADPGPCPALCLALLAVCAFLVLASWLLQGDLYGRVFRDTIVAVIVIAVVRGRGNTSFAADICATCLLQPVLVVAVYFAQVTSIKSTDPTPSIDPVDIDDRPNSP